MTSLHYQVYGSGARKLVVLHGLFGSGDNWRSIAQKYLQSDFEVYLIDQRNHGRSFHHPVHTYDALAKDVLALLDELALSHVTLLGHSMGGKTAMRLAELAGDRISQLIVADIAPRAYVHSHTHIIEAMKSLPVTEATSRKELEVFMEARLPDPVLRGFLLKSVERLESGHYRWRINIPAIENDYDAIIGWEPFQQALKLPTLFVAGGASKYISADDHDIIHSHFENSNVVTIPGAGHWLHYQAPKPFTEEIRRFTSS